RFQILRKPLGLSFSEEDLAAELHDILLGCFEDDRLEACCILTKTDPRTVRLRQMAVSSNLQGKGIGRVLMSFAENVARDHGYRRLTMHARKSAIGFYEKNGYRICSDEFLEVTIPHYVMEKEL
ncbi:MAG: GNAT family N-acetyltransferase, partial [Chitinophagaceae bacterium]|nr:GNAT family N-acetyltransferase [Chitinophagaceae bacterium]